MASLLQKLTKGRSIKDLLKAYKNYSYRTNKKTVDSLIRKITGNRPDIVKDATIKAVDDLLYGLKKTPENIKVMYQKPNEFAKAVESSLGYSKLGNLSKKATEGILEGTTVGAIDIPVEPSRNLAERSAYVGGFLTGTAVSPITKMLSVAGKALPQAGRLSTVTKPLASLEQKAITQPGKLGTLGKLGSNAIRGVPFNLSWYGLHKLSPQDNKTTKSDVAFDTAVDAAVPFAGPLLIGGLKRTNLSDSILKRAKELGVEENVQKMAGKFNDKLINNYLDLVEKSKKPEYKKAALEFDKSLKENQQEISSFLAKKSKLDKLNKQVRALYNKYDSLQDPKQKEVLLKKIDKIKREIKSLTKSDVSARGKVEQVGDVAKRIDDILGRNPEQRSEILKEKLGVAREEFEKKVGEGIPQDKAELIGVAEDVANKVKEIIATKYSKDPNIIEAINSGEVKDPDIKKLMTSLGDIFKKVTGKEFEYRENYFPKAHLDKAGYGQIALGDSLIDSLEDFYDPSKARKDVEGYVKDPMVQIDMYLDAIKYHANKAAKDAAGVGISEEAAKLRNEVSKKVKEEVKTEGSVSSKTASELYDTLKQIGIESGHAEGKEPIRLKSIKDIFLSGEGGFGRFKRQFVDPVNKLIDVGLYDHITELVNKEPAIGIARDEIQKVNYDVDKTIDIIHKMYPDSDIVSITNWLKKVEKFGGDIPAVVETILRREQNKLAERQIYEVLPRIEFPDRETEEEIKQIIADQLVKNAKVDKLSYKIMEKMRMAQVLAKLGFNVTSAMYNISEIGRLPGTLERPQDFLGVAAKVLKEPYSFAKRMGLENDKFFKEIHAKNRVKSSDVEGARKVLGKSADALMFLFNKSEELKNEIFLRAYWEEGKRKGLEGKELRDYTMQKFYQYGHMMSSLTSPEYTKNPYLRTILQFSQYPVKDLYLTLKKVGELRAGGKKSKDAAKYLIGKVFTSLLFYNLYKQMGLNPMSAVLSLPFGLEMYDEDKPLKENARYTTVYSSAIIDTYDMLKDYVDNLNEFQKTGEMPDEGLVRDYIERRLIRDIASFIPGGVQTMKTGSGIAALLRGGVYTSKFKDPNLRYAVNTDFRTKEGIENLIKAPIFGANALGDAQTYWSAYNKWKKPYQYPSLTSRETEIFNRLNPSDRLNYWRKTFADKVADYAPKEAQIVSEKVTEPIPTFSVGSEPMKVATQGMPDTNTMIFMQNAIDDQNYSEMQKFENVLAQKVKKGVISEADYERMLEEHAREIGYDITKYRNRQYAKDMTTEDKAKIISNYLASGQVDIADWYNSKLLTKEVAKELERMGVIDSADEFWNNAKMTDPYYRNKELQKLQEKLAKTQSKIVSENMKLRIKNAKERMSYADKLRRLTAKDPYKGLAVEGVKIPGFKAESSISKPRSFEFDTKVNKSYLSEFIK